MPQNNDHVMTPYLAELWLKPPHERTEKERADLEKLTRARSKLLQS